MHDHKTGGADNDEREIEAEDKATNSTGDDVPWRTQSRGKSGQWGSELTVDALRDYLNEEPPGAFTASIADEFGVSTDTVRRRCRELVENGELLERGGAAGIFWQPITW